MPVTSQLEQFLTVETPTLLTNLSEETAPKWGIMTAQHMVEHLAGTMRLSNGKRAVNRITPIEQLESRRNFLFGPQPFQKNIKPNPGPAVLQELKLINLDAAKIALLNEIQDFLTYFEGHDGLKPMNPIYGELTKQEWIIFHQKHFKHHFTQFGLLVTE